MKSPSTLVSLIILFCSIQFSLIGQDGCPGSKKNYFLNGNNIRAAFSPRGNKFFNSEGGFQVPFPSDQHLSTIFASSPWIGAMDDAGNLKLAAEAYANVSSPDYRVGPLSDNGLPLDSVCNFDRAWNVYYEDIISHRNDYMADGVIDDTIVSIFNWPAYGNLFFTTYNGFDLPSDDTQEWADFYDSNGNDRYDPDKGDYPVVYFNNRMYIPEQILWMVFNDAGKHKTSGGDPLRFEIQLTVFAFNCLDNELLNNTVFNSYKILNRSLIPLDSIFFGIWTDYDLGCPSDDYTGSDSIRSTEFVYNADAIDGDHEADCSIGSDTYASMPPVQSMTYLSHQMHSFISIPFSAPSVPQELYNQLNGLWADGTPITPEGNGYNPGSTAVPTKFLYNGDPRDSASWSAINVIQEGFDTRTISSVKLGRLNPGDIEVVETAYTFHQDPERNHLDQITLMHENLDLLISSVEDLNNPCTLYPVCENEDCVWPGDFNHDGIADHFDLLYWGVMKDHVGHSRNGLVTWRGHYADNWPDVSPDGVNFKHADATGDGIVTTSELDWNLNNFLLTTPEYYQLDLYPEGPEILISSGTISPEGRMSIKIETGKVIENVLGLAFEIEFDTTIFNSITNYISNWPGDTNTVAYSLGVYTEEELFLSRDTRWAHVQTNHQNIDLPAEMLLYRSLGPGITLKSGLSTSDIPDSTTIRLRNLIAIDAEGNDLHIGSNTLVVYKEGVTAVTDPSVHEINIYPNPVDHLLYIDTPDRIRCELINPQGQVLKSFLISNQPLDVSGFIPGLYYLRFPTLAKTLKLVIQF